MGVGQGVQPLLGYCVGARTWERYNKILKFSLSFSLILSIVMTVLCYFFTNQIVGGFLTETNAFEYGVHFAKILLTTSVFFGVFYVLTNALQAMGANGLIWAQPVADILSIGLAVALYITTSKKMMHLS